MHVDFRPDQLKNASATPAIIFLHSQLNKMHSTQLIRCLLKNNIKNNYSTAIVKQNVKSSRINYWAISIQQDKSGS